MEARRANVARKDGLRRLYMVAGLALVASLAIGAVAISKSSWLDIESVQVVGTDRANPQHIVTASGIRVGEPLAEIDIDGSAQAIRRVPWVATASVDRHWGGAVTIEVSERVGIVALPTGSRVAVVDKTGQQLELLPALPEGFIPVTGVEASGVPGQPVTDEAMSVVSLVSGLTPAVSAATEQIVVEQGQLMLDLTVGGRANLGDVRDLDAKLLALETILARVDLKCLAVIDVRVPEAPTVRRTPAETARAAADQEPLAEAVGC